MGNLKYILIFLSITCLVTPFKSQDILGGEIITSQISSLSYKIDIFIYTKTSIGNNDSLIMGSTNGPSGPYSSLSGQPTNISNDVTKWEYTFNHTYPGPGTYTIAIKDSSRIANIINVSNSSTEIMLLQKDIIISPFIGINNSPILQSPPTAISINAGNFIYNLNAIDIDGDSLSYTLIPVSTSNYSFPTGAEIDSVTGDFSMPVASGSYAIGIQIDEWRLSTIIGSTIREMIIDNNLVTSIKTETYIENIKIFPNPNSGLFKIELNDVSDSVEVNIFNIAGKLIFSKKHNDNTLNIDISNHPKGIYLVKVVSENNVIVQKIIYD